MELKRLLIANRGEIAVRIMRACRELGIESVAVYSDADAQAQHVLAADLAVRLGPAPPSESYLSIPAILAAAQATGAQAVHPGYGFLSENEDFASACEAAGLVFVGPPADVIARMGSKIEARRTMEAAGVPIVPGETPADQSDDGVRQAALRVGLPVLIKASAGGGGKGMRRVYRDEELLDAVQAARREAQSAFGDGTLYVERLIDRPHHVEVQIMASAIPGTSGAPGAAGGSQAVHLFERECSVQRRHQKVIEETPSPLLTPSLRAKMTDAAVRAAQAAGYRNAGTIEFLVEAHQGAGDPRFYFLEMNTRLQVEHPITELVTGVDLVHAQLAVAMGRPLPWTQAALAQRGHAIEARVYAESPARGFIPQAGPLLVFRPPRMPGVRVDTGVVEGDQVPVHYDPLLAKVTALAETRPQAIQRLAQALRAFPILGIETNIPFLIAVLESEAFAAGDIDTGFLDRETDRLVASIETAPEAGVRDEALPDVVRAAWDADRGAAASASTVAATHAAADWDPWSATSGLVHGRRP